jgi:hypothetical protein
MWIPDERDCRSARRLDEPTTSREPPPSGVASPLTRVSRRVSVPLRPSYPETLTRAAAGRRARVPSRRGHRAGDAHRWRVRQPATDAPLSTAARFLADCLGSVGRGRDHCSAHQPGDGAMDSGCPLEGDCPCSPPESRERTRLAGQPCGGHDLRPVVVKHGTRGS